MSPYGQGDVSRTAQYFRLLKMARIVKTLRIIRIFKLARHSTGLQALGNTMKANYKELGLLFLLLGMGAIMFASLIFVFEKEDADTTFKTMFDAYWWAIITMTTVSINSTFCITSQSILTNISGEKAKLAVSFKILRYTLYSLSVVGCMRSQWEVVRSPRRSDLPSGEEVSFSSSICEFSSSYL